MNWEIILLLTALMLFAYWFNYVMGGPLAEPSKVDAGAFLFVIPNSWAIARLKDLNIYKDFHQDFIQEISMTQDKKTRLGLVKDHKLTAYLAGREFFTWERSVLCPICFHWWLTIAVGAVLLGFNLLHAREHVPLAAFTYLVNHFIIRKIS